MSYHDDIAALAILAEEGDVLTNPAARWRRAQEIAHSASELLALKADGRLIYADLRITIYGRSIDCDEAGDLMRLRLLDGKRDEAEVIAHAITEALVAEVDRLLKAGEIE